MLLAKISFVPHMDHDESELVAVAERYLTALLKNGQIVGEYNTGWREGIFEAFVSASHRESLHSRYDSRWVTEAVAALKLQFGTDPECEILDDDVSVPVPTLKSATSVFIYGDGLTFGSGVRHGNRGTPLPLPLLPINDELREEVFLWRQSYVNHDRIWFGGGPLEIAAYCQLADPKSELITEGRDIALRMENELQLPVFLYLLRHWGDTEIEKDRPCPGCGNSWRNDDSPAPSREPFHRFHFKCEPCRLVSHRAVTFDNSELAQIGAFAITESKSKLESPEIAEQIPSDSPS